MRAIRTKPFALVIAAIVVMTTAVGAYAYWTSGGGGTDTAATGTSDDLVVVQTSVITDLRPGGAAQTLAGTFDNRAVGPSTSAL